MPNDSYGSPGTDNTDFAYRVNSDGDVVTYLVYYSYGSPNVNYTINSYQIWLDGNVYYEGSVTYSYGQPDNWWLRSPHTDNGNGAYYVVSDGNIYHSNYHYVDDSYGNFISYTNIII